MTIRIGIVTISDFRRHRNDSLRAIVRQRNEYLNPNRFGTSGKCQQEEENNLREGIHAATWCGTVHLGKSEPRAIVHRD